MRVIVPTGRRHFPCVFPFLSEFTVSFLFTLVVTLAVFDLINCIKDTMLYTNYDRYNAMQYKQTYI